MFYLYRWAEKTWHNNYGSRTESVQVYSLTPYLRSGAEPNTGEQVNELEAPEGTRPLHLAHSEGLLHAGVWLHVLDNQGKVSMIAEAPCIFHILSPNHTNQRNLSPGPYFEA